MLPDPPGALFPKPEHELAPDQVAIDEASCVLDAIMARAQALLEASAGRGRRAAAALPVPRYLSPATRRLSPVARRLSPVASRQPLAASRLWPVAFRQVPCGRLQRRRHSAGAHPLPAGAYLPLGPHRVRDQARAARAVPPAASRDARVRAGQLCGAGQLGERAAVALGLRAAQMLRLHPCTRGLTVDR